MFKTLIACLAALAFVNAEDGRIIGGQIINIRQTPYLIQLRLHGQHFCGGTLVKKNYVVTAAHCLDDINPLDITIVGGASLASEAGEASRKVIQFWVPPQYERDLKDMDIAVLKLAGDLTGANIQTIPLCSRAVALGDRLQVSGWGKISENGPYPEELRTVVVPTISKVHCAQAHKGVARMTNSMICGSEPGVKDACTGDSGGPAVMNGELCGVVSWGIGCGRRNFPGVYTGIDEARAFVTNALRQ